MSLRMEVPVRDAVRRLPILWLMLGVIAVGTFVVVVPPGLPYDEPAHWINVLYYADHVGLPRLGTPGTSYEAQQGPLYYALAGLVVRGARGIGLTTTAQFYAVRAVGGALVLVLGWLVYRLIGRPGQRTLTLLLPVLTPILLAIGASIQNDTLALCLAFWALGLAIRGARGEGRLSGAGVAVGVGLVLGAALLTKYTALPAVVAIALWWTVRDGRRGARRSALMILVIAVVTGWYWVRNLVEYGSVLGVADTDTAGVAFPPYVLHGLGSVVDVVRNVVTYLWVPTEYYRNVIGLPAAGQVVLVLVTAVVAVVAAVHVWGSARALAGAGGLDARWAAARSWLRSSEALVVLAGLCAVVMWACVFLGVSAVAPRIGYVALPLWFAGLLAVVGGGPGGRWRGRGLLALLIALDVWVLLSVLSSGVRLLSF